MVLRRGPGRGGERCDALDRIYTRLPGDLQRTRTRRRPRAGRLHKATLTATAPSHITNGDNWYAASGAAGCGSIFGVRLEYVIARAAMAASWSCATIVEAARAVVAAAPVQRMERAKVRPHAGRLRHFGNDVNKYDHVGMDALRRAFPCSALCQQRAGTWPTRPNFLGAAARRWECFYLGIIAGRMENPAARNPASAARRSCWGARRRFLEGPRGRRERQSASLTARNRPTRSARPTRTLHGAPRSSSSPAVPSTGTRTGAWPCCIDAVAPARVWGQTGHRLEKRPFAMIRRS